MRVCVCVRRCGLIHVGDEVHEVNGTKTQGKSPQEVIDIIVSTPRVHYECYIVRTLASTPRVIRKYTSEHTTSTS